MREACAECKGRIRGRPGWFCSITHGAEVDGERRHYNFCTKACLLLFVGRLPGRTDVRSR